MKRCKWPLVRDCLFLAAIALGPAPPTQSDDKVSSVTQELRGGEVITGYTGVVELSIGGVSSCTGSMIGPDLLLTAAHCLQSVGLTASRSSGSGLFMVWYFDPLTGRREVFNGSANWFAHADYGNGRSPGGAGAVNADIAVIRISGKFKNTDHEDYLRLYAGGREQLRTRLTAYGAGIYTYSGKNDTNVRSHWFSVESVAKNHIVIDTRKKVGVCKGDSGGPLVYEARTINENFPLIAGVAGRIEIFGGEPDVCTNNDFGLDDAFYSRTNWEKLETIISSADARCSLQNVDGSKYRRCFSIPFIENIDYEGFDTGIATAITMAVAG